MLKSLSIGSFKSLKNVEVELGLVNVFIGANGSGKSNLLEALGVLGAAASGRVDDESLRRRGVRPGVSALYTSSFKGQEQPASIAFQASNAKTHYRVSLSNMPGRRGSAWKYETEILRGVVDRSRDGLEALNENAGLAALKSVGLAEKDPGRLLLDSLSNYAIYAPDTAKLSGQEQDPQQREPVGLAGGRLPEAVDELLLQGKNYDLRRDVTHMIGWLAGIGVRYPSGIVISTSAPQPDRTLYFHDRFMEEGRDTLSAYDASEGILYVLFSLVLAQHSESPAVYAIDNFDHALNPRLAKSLTALLCKLLVRSGKRQALLTSHNPLVLDGLPLQDNKVRLFAVDRSQSGETVVQRIVVDNQLLELADKGVPLSQQWVMGNLGGVPSGV